MISRGISIDYNHPASEKQIRSKPEAWIRRVYNNIIATSNLVDISKAKGKDLLMDHREDYDVFMSYSFPCQDLSLAGKLRGMDADSGTRSSMVWQVGRILREMKEMGQLPDVLMMENVQNVIGKNNLGNFNRWLNLLEELGYMSYVDTLTATDFGIPQTRKRVFVISVLGKYSYEFPKGWELTKCLNDFLETDVDEKYYLSGEAIQRILHWNTNTNTITDSCDRGG